MSFVVWNPPPTLKVNNIWYSNPGKSKWWMSRLSSSPIRQSALESEVRGQLMVLWYSISDIKSWSKSPPKSLPTGHFPFWFKTFLKRSETKVQLGIWPRPHWSNPLWQLFGSFSLQEILFAHCATLLPHFIVDAQLLCCILCTIVASRLWLPCCHNWLILRFWEIFEVINLFFPPAWLLLNKVCFLQYV